MGLLLCQHQLEEAEAGEATRRDTQDLQGNSAAARPFPGSSPLLRLWMTAGNETTTVTINTVTTQMNQEHPQPFCLPFPFR